MVLGIAAVRFLHQPDGHLGECVTEAAAAMVPLLEQELPDLIYLPHAYDWHPDHRACLPIVNMALASCDVPRPRLLCYEILTPLTEYDEVTDISSVMQRKRKAVRAHRSQVKRLPYDSAVRGLNQYRGAVTHLGQFAEVFAEQGPKIAGIPRERRADPDWHRTYRVVREIDAIIPRDATFILVDDDRLDIHSFTAPRKCIPFLERDGHYWGKPADDATAICEPDRLQRAGAAFIVSAATARWWLNHYSALACHLENHFRCVCTNDALVMFDLRQPKPRLTMQRSKQQR